jgi:hypothetical protein
MPVAHTAKTKGYDSWTDKKRYHFTRLLTFSGNYSTGGDTINFSSTEIKGGSLIPPIFTNVNGLAVTPYKYTYVPGTGIKDGKIRITNTTTGVELAAGAYPAAITADVVTFYGIILPI